MKKYLINIRVLLWLLASVSFKSAGAQMYLSDWVNDASATYDFSNAEIVVTALPSGIGYLAKNGGSHYHYGPAAATLTVNGNYDAFNSTPLTPGYDYFSGLDGLATTAVEIAGNTAPIFGNLYFQNGGTNPVSITNSNGIAVGGLLSFENGITTTVRSNINTGAIQFLDNATYTNTALADAQHVNGYVTKTGNDAFTFPVGSGTDARTISMSAPGSITDAYSSAWIAGDPTTTGDPSNGNAMHPVTSFGLGILSVSTAGQWDWIAVNGTGAGLTITVSIPDLDLLNHPVTAANLRLVGWNGTQWIDLSGSANATGNTEGSTLSGTMQAGITAIAIGSVNNVLPVLFSNFNGTLVNCSGLLQWTTATEINSSRYEIEYSKDGRNFIKVGEVVSKNNSTGSSYSFSYGDVVNGANYFRIRAVDIDARNFTTGIIRINSNCNDKPVVSIYPNPASNQVTISGITSKSSIVILDATGKQIITVQGNNFAQTINISGFAKGTYIVRVINENGTIVNTKIIKN